jgi:hypothetical protein
VALLRPPRRQVPAIAAAISAAGAALLALVVPSGCNIVAPIAYAIEGPGTIEAEHTLAAVDTVVLVDDPRSRMPRLPLRVELGEAVGRILLREKLVPKVISTRDAVAFMRSNDRRSTPASVEAVAKAVGASQVVYIQVVEFSLRGQDGSPRPFSQVLVRVIDVGGRTRAYPADPPEGRLVLSQTREASTELYATPSSRRVLEESLVAKAAVDVAKLFYKHDRVEFGENLRDR